jgi:hypothetical protein
MTTRIALLGAIAAATLAACATGPTKPVASAAPAGCVRDTGSRVPPSKGCAGFGSTYTQEDLARTGQTTAGGALGLLDPTITVSH